MTWTAAIYRWNSLSWQYKSENPVGNPLFPQRRLSESGDLGNEFIREDRLIKPGLGRIGFEETPGAGQQKIQGREAFSNVETSTTGGQKQEREQGRAEHTFAGEIHLVASMSGKSSLAIFKGHFRQYRSHLADRPRCGLLRGVLAQLQLGHRGYKPARSIKFRDERRIPASNGYDRSGHTRIDYIVQPEMKMVKLNEMRTFRRDAFRFWGGVRCSPVFSYFKDLWKEFNAPVRGIGRGAALLGVLMIFAQRASATDTNTTRGYLELEYQKWSKQFHTNTNSAEAAWNFGRACFDMSTLQKDAAAEAKYAQEGIDATRAAVALAPSSAPAHYYLGMDLGQLADTKRNLSAFRMVKDMEREFSAARALDQHFDFAGPSRNLGLLYRDAPTIISIGSRAKARQYLEESVELAPGFPENQLNLIESYLKWDYKTEAVRQFGDLEKIWPQAQKEFTGVAWETSWKDWNKRLDAIRKKLEKNPKNESPHSQ